MRFDITIIILLILSFSPLRAVIASDKSLGNNSDLPDVFYRQSREEDVKWAAGLANSTLEMVWQNLKEIFAKQEEKEKQNTTPSIYENSGRKFGGLYVFVSSSMPIALLKNYLEEANKYGAVLVLKGLPQGSFKELSKFVIEIAGNKDNLEESAESIQVDDGAYVRFSVSSVPTIVLSMGDEYHPGKDSVVKFDKMVGNVGIKYALEQFSRSGELRQQAWNILND